MDERAPRRPHLEPTGIANARRARALRLRCTRVDQRLVRAAASLIGERGISGAAYTRCIIRMDALRVVLLSRRSHGVPMRGGFRLWAVNGENLRDLTLAGMSQTRERAWVETLDFNGDIGKFPTGVAAAVTFAGDQRTYLVDAKAVDSILEPRTREPIAPKVDRRAVNVRPRGRGGRFVAGKHQSVMPSAATPQNPAPATADPATSSTDRIAQAIADARRRAERSRPPDEAGPS